MTGSNRWLQEVRANMWFYLRGVIDVIDGIYNCVLESEKAFLVPVSTKGIEVDHNRGNWIEQHSEQDSYLIQKFYSQLLRYNQPANGENRGETAVFAGKDTLKQ